VDTANTLGHGAGLALDVALIVIVSVLTLEDAQFIPPTQNNKRLMMRRKSTNE
jgi:hypothetical protein